MSHSSDILVAGGLYLKHGTLYRPIKMKFSIYFHEKLNHKLHLRDCVKSISQSLIGGGGLLTFRT